MSGAPNPHVVTEGVSGMHHYHLSSAEKPWAALCGAQTMATSIRRVDWKRPFGEHFPKRPTWCENCERKAQ